MADDVFPEETHATIKPIASRIWDIVYPDIDDEDGSVIESICDDCSYYSVDVE